MWQSTSWDGNASNGLQLFLCVVSVKYMCIKLITEAEASHNPSVQDFLLAAEYKKTEQSYFQ